MLADKPADRGDTSHQGMTELEEDADQHGEKIR
jgi:hypothetical protein